MNEVLTLQVCATGCAVSILLYASVYTLVVFKYFGASWNPGQRRMR